MSIRLPNQNKQYAQLNSRLARYVAAVEALYENLCKQTADAVTLVDVDGVEKFKFNSDPILQRKVDEIQQEFVSNLRAMIYSGTSDEWKRSNLFQDLIADKVLKKYKRDLSKSEYNTYYRDNSDALKAFQYRRDRGLNLSQKLWKQSAKLKTEMEDALSCSIEKGIDAVTLSKRLSKYLSDFPSLQTDYKERFGTASKAIDCEYRSIRLARSEINMAYRTAEQTRWRQFDFVIGYEIKLSHSHPREDVCDRLAGKYPKDFVWSGFHPNDLCYCIPILKSEEEFLDDSITPKNEVSGVPQAFNDWCQEYKDSIEGAYKRGTLPYFLKDNPKYLMPQFGKQSQIYGSILHAQAVDVAKASKTAGDDFQSIASTLAKKYGGTVTPLNYKSVESIERKCRTDNTNPSFLKDVVRTTVIVPKEHINHVLHDLQSDSIFLRLKRQTPDKFDGYSGNIVNVRHPNNGAVGEIQVNTAKMIYGKETEDNARRILGDSLWEKIKEETGLQGGLGHKYYEQIRVLDVNIPAEKAKYETLRKEMREYYSHFNT